MLEREADFEKLNLGPPDLEDTDPGDTDLANPDSGDPTLELPKVLAALGAGFAAQNAGQTAPPERFAGSSGGFLPGVPAYAVRVPGAEGNETVKLLDLRTDAPLATFGADLVAALGGGASAALATHRLARPGAGTLALLGVGGAERWFLRSLAALRGLERVQLYEPKPFQAGRFAAELARELRAKLVVADGPDEALLDAEIVLAAPPRLAFLDPESLRPGGHLTVFSGRDDLRAGGLPAAWLQGARVVADDPALLAELGLFEGEVDTGELGAGAVSGASPRAERTLYLALGPAWQDLAVAWSLYRTSLAGEIRPVRKG